MKIYVISLYSQYHCRTYKVTVIIASVLLPSCVCFVSVRTVASYVRSYVRCSYFTTSKYFHSQQLNNLLILYDKVWWQSLYRDNQVNIYICMYM